MKISVIIPTYNESGVIGRTVNEVARRAGQGVHEIIIADGNSRDATRSEAAAAGARVVSSPGRGRATQMNYGAGKSTGDILYFLHADTLPPSGFDGIIRRTVAGSYAAGCFRLNFDASHFLLDTYAWFTKFDCDAFRYGDQSLFILRTAFEKIGGYREDHKVMEDNEIVRRIKRNFSFRISGHSVTTASRRYLQNGVVKLQMVYMLIWLLYMAGASQDILVRIYEKCIQ